MVIDQAPTPVVTPRGPATLRASFLGPLPHMPLPPRVVVGWSVQVGEGGAPGPVALRVLSGNPVPAGATGLQRGAVEHLAAAPGTYAFPARLRAMPHDVAGLDQEAGGHAIVASGRHQDHTVDVWRPPLGDGETRDRDERMRDRQLLVSLKFENDLDRDGFGDATQDENDLALRAAVDRRSVRVTVRNRGARPVHQPRVLVRMRGARLRDPARPRSELREKPPPPGYEMVRLPRIPAGGRRTVVVRASRAGFRVKLIADSEGFDPTRSSLVVRGRRR